MEHSYHASVVDAALKLRRRFHYAAGLIGTESTRLKLCGKGLRRLCQCYWEDFPRRTVRSHVTIDPL